MASGNTVGEDLSVGRSDASFHRYEYVKPGTRFPFIIIIESPTLLDVAGYLAAVKLADQHGYGKYSANHGKFETQFLAVSTGYPLFSVLNMLKWLENGSVSDPQAELQFESVVGQPVSLFGNDIAEAQKKFNSEFNSYVSALNATSKDDGAKGKGKKSK
jgi:hypothetical protein